MPAQLAHHQNPTPLDPLYYRDWTGSAGAGLHQQGDGCGRDWGNWHSGRVMGAEYLRISR
jgi:hypothetical protein